MEDQLQNALCFGTPSIIIDIQKTTVEETREGWLEAEAREGGLGAPASTVLFIPLTPDPDRQLLAEDLLGAG